MIEAVRRLSILLLFLVPFVNVIAQPPQDLEKDLKGKVVLLRSNGAENKITFDAQGNPSQKLTPYPFALSALEVKDVHVSNDSLRIEGTRALLIYSAGTDTSVDAIRAVPLNHLKVAVAIALDRSHPETLQTVVTRIFALTVADALAAQSAEERQTSLYTVAALAPPEKPKSSNPSNSAANPVTDPRVIYSVDPEFTEKAQHEHFGGVCVVSIKVDTNGFPIHARIMRPLEPGLDEKAILAVSQFRFKPAISDGKPLAVQVVIEMNFHPH